ncbi:MAG TPA: zinc ribbon domain-containing protein [Armatimonadota bacterium]|nr:zinc ribbon domain-containing protein [Armatimonadota bacterium]
MDFFKQAGKALGDLGRQAGRQADILALQAQLGSLEGELDEVYSQAGRRAEELVKARQVRDEEIQVILRRVKDIQGKMMDLRRQVHELQTGQQPAAPAGTNIIPQPDAGPRCSQCGKLASGDETFCNNCGAKLSRPDGG